MVIASHNGSEYTLSIVNAPELTRSSIALLEANAEAAIKYLGDYIEWKGVLDFVLYWDRDRILGNYWRADGPGFAAWGDHYVMSALVEATTGVDVNEEDFDAGMWVGPYNTSIADYGEDIYIDPDPNPIDDDILSRDFLSTFLHECLHSLGIWSNLQLNREIPPTKFDTLTEKIGDQWFFIGNKTKEVYGGPLPLAITGSRDHYSDGVEFDADLMREFGYREKWQISDLDLAILYDLGHNVIKWVGDSRELMPTPEPVPTPEPTPEQEPGPEYYDGIIKSVSGKGKLKGTSAADVFTFDSFESFTRKSADKIIGFDASEGDRIAVSAVAFPGLEGASEINFVSAKSYRELKRFSKEDYDFVYFKNRSLYFDGNSSDKKWGDSNEGGLVAIFKGKPDLTVEDFTLLA